MQIAPLQFNLMCMIIENGLNIYHMKNSSMLQEVARINLWHGLWVQVI